jgi:hypothetical protein
MGTRPKGDEPAKREPKPKRGPKPETLVLPGPWEDAVAKSLKKKRPEGGWPKPQKKGQGK